MKEKVFQKYKNIILSVEEIRYIAKKRIEQYKAKLILKDGSNLRITEIWIDKNLDKYSYYWLDEENKVITGWDNATHYKKLRNFPHHKHIKEKVFPSYENNLDNVLNVISKHFNKKNFF